MKALITLLLIFMSSSLAEARAVSYPGGWMVMQAHDSYENDLSVMFSPTASYAVGARSEFFRKDERSLHSLQINKLLKRWNLEDAQGNIFLLSGAGVAENDRHSALALWTSVEGDFETRRYYISYENRAIYSGNIETTYRQKARIGIAPYIAEYTGLHSWLMVQLDHTSKENDHFMITPLVRMFTRNLLWELGVNNKHTLVNVTWQF